MRGSDCFCLSRMLGAGLLTITVALPPSAAGAQARQQPDSAAQFHDGQRDFDFEIGSWRTTLSRLAAPLTGSTTWVEYEGTTTVTPIWGGNANLVELLVDGPAGRIEALSLRLYDPATRQWSLNFANSRIGRVTPPTVGGFRNGRGEFHSREALDGRPILVRFLIMPITPDSIRFEQAFSDDDGRTWEVNWIATDTRLTREP